MCKINRKRTKRATIYQKTNMLYSPVWKWFQDNHTGLVGIEVLYDTTWEPKAETWGGFQTEKLKGDSLKEISFLQHTFFLLYIANKKNTLIFCFCVCFHFLHPELFYWFVFFCTFMALVHVVENEFFAFFSNKNQSVSLMLLLLRPVTPWKDWTLNTMRSLIFSLTGLVGSPSSVQRKNYPTTGLISLAGAQ